MHAEISQKRDGLIALCRRYDVARLEVFGVISGKHWSAIFTRRDGKLRLISVRRARDEEIARYES